jgi:tetratricopeptide (TPR) repeat protein
MQKVPEATASLMKALSLKPDSAPIIFALAETHKRSQQWIKALLLYQKGIKMGANKEHCTREITNCLNFSVARRQRPKVAS